MLVSAQRHWAISRHVTSSWHQESQSLGRIKRQQHRQRSCLRCVWPPMRVVSVTDLSKEPKQQKEHGSQLTVYSWHGDRGTSLGGLRGVFVRAASGPARTQT